MSNGKRWLPEENVKVKNWVDWNPGVPVHGKNIPQDLLEALPNRPPKGIAKKVYLLRKARGETKPRPQGKSMPNKHIDLLERAMDAIQELLKPLLEDIVSLRDENQRLKQMLVDLKEVRQAVEKFSSNYVNGGK